MFYYQNMSGTIIKLPRKSSSEWRPSDYRFTNIDLVWVEDISIKYKLTCFSFCLFFVIGINYYKRTNNERTLTELKSSAFPVYNYFKLFRQYLKLKKKRKLDIHFSVLSECLENFFFILVGLFRTFDVSTNVNR